jgi:glutathione S-transferase
MTKEINIMKFFYSPGACSIAAHIALEMAQANYAPVRVAIANEENLKPEFLAINPQGRVPVLAVDDEVITELPAILLYVDRAFPAAQLMPKSALDFARAVSMMAFLSSNVHIAIATIWRPERFTDDKQAKALLETDGLRHLKAHFERIEAQLPDNGWLFNAPQASLADLNLLPFYRFGLRLDLSMAEFPRYTSLVRRAEMLPTVRRVLDREKVESFLSSKPAAL